MISGVLSPKGFLRVIVILFPCYSSDFSVSIFYFKIILPSLQLVCPRVFFPYLLIEFSFLILESLVWTVLLDSISVSFNSLFSPVSFHLSLQFASSHLLLVFSSQYVPVFLSFFSIFACFRNFFNCPSSPISHQRFCMFFFGGGSYRAHRFY